MITYLALTIVVGLMFLLKDETDISILVVGILVAWLADTVMLILRLIA